MDGHVTKPYLGLSHCQYRRLKSSCNLNLLIYSIGIKRATWTIDWIQGKHAEHLCLISHTFQLFVSVFSQDHFTDDANTWQIVCYSYQLYNNNANLYANFSINIPHRIWNWLKLRIYHHNNRNHFANRLHHFCCCCWFDIPFFSFSCDVGDCVKSNVTMIIPTNSSLAYI